MTSRRTVILRLVLAVLILLNMAMIFRFSNEDAQVSTSTSGKVAETTARATNYSHYKEKTEPEQKKIVQKMQFPIRKIAHMTEFGTLAGLIFLLLLTYPGRAVPRAAASVAAAAVYAVSDELHQKFMVGRVSNIRDIILFDTGGALIVCSLILTVVLLFRRSRNRPPRVTVCRIPCPSADLTKDPFRIAVAADLHGRTPDPVLNLLKEQRPDMILIPGDLTDRESILAGNPEPERFLRECAAIAPTFYSIGNHETGCFHRGNPFVHPTKKPLPDSFAGRVAESGAHLLRNESAECAGLTVCGLDSGLDGKVSRPDAEALERFSSLGGFRILLCHHPEYYVPYIRKTGIELTVCGHAHGGQWRFFGRGIYSPGQGLFPKYTSGTLDGGRCIISRGLGDHTHVPRIFNPRELVIIELYGESANDNEAGSDS